MMKSVLILSFLFISNLVFAASKRLTVMTFNVENLFDTEDDPDKNDENYLPLARKKTSSHRELCKKIEKQKWRQECLYADWNEKILKIKLKRLAEVILAPNQGKGPDIVLLQEVENLPILERLRREHLTKAEFTQAVLIEGTDKRGIDVAMLSKLAIVGQPSLHKIEFSEKDRTRAQDSRGILQADFRLSSGDTLTALAVHFPAPFHPRTMREHAYHRLNQILADLPPERLVVAGGDFNTPRDEMNSGIRETYLLPHWLLAFEKCTGCPGTNYFPQGKSWSFLDLLLVRFPRKTTWRLEKVELNNRNPQQSDKGRPKRFNIESGTGVSDHWPLAMTLLTN